MELKATTDCAVTDSIRLALVDFGGGSPFSDDAFFLLPAFFGEARECARAKLVWQPILEGLELLLAQFLFAGLQDIGARLRKLQDTRLAAAAEDDKNNTTAITGRR